MHLALVGPKGEWRGAGSIGGHLSAMTADERTQALAAEGEFEWPGRYFGPIAAGEGPLQHEWAPVLEFKVPRLRYDPRAGTSPVLEWLLGHRPGIADAAASLGVSPEQQEQFKRAYVGTDLWVRSEIQISRGDILEADRLLGLAFEADPQDRWISYGVADRLLASIEAAPERGLTREELLRRILSINPWSAEGWRALWTLQRARGDPAAAESLARLRDLSPLDRSARAPN
jgi:spermidine synthase